MFEENLHEEIVQLYNEFDEVDGNSDILPREQEQLNKIRTALDALYASTQSRQELQQIRWDRIAENAEEFADDIPDTVGIPEGFSVEDQEYNDMINEIDDLTYNVISNLQRLAELAEELNDESL